MQMFDDAHVKRPKKEQVIEVEIEQDSSQTDSAGTEEEQEKGVQAGKAEEVTFEPPR